MTDSLTRYRAVSSGFTARLDALTNEQWSARTPCDQWTVRELVAHVIGTQRFSVAQLDGTEAQAVDPEGDLVAQWRSASAAVLAGLEDTERAQTTVTSPQGEQPFAALAGGLICADTLVHTWDLARATGQDERLDAEAVDNTMAMMSSFGDGMRRPGLFGAEVTAPEGADAQTTMLCFSGRAV